MDLLFTYAQEKEDKRNTVSNSILNVFEDETNIKFIGNFYFEYANNIKMTITHELDLNYISGDFKITYIHKNNNKITQKVKYNDFKLLVSLVEIGMIQGENSRTYWGVQYRKAIDKVSTLFYNKVKNRFNNKYYQKSLSGHKSAYSLMYRLIVNYYLDKNNIVSHDGIYHIIEDNFPSKKWLNKNNNNFLPAVLDSYGIKSKYLIKEININPDLKINLKTLRYLCNLFGTNYIDYIRKIDWKSCASSRLCYKKGHTIKTDHEKRMMVKIINELKENNSSTKSVIQLVYNFLSSVDDIRKLGLDIKFKYNDVESFYRTFDEVNGILKHKKRGYRIRYCLPTDFSTMVQEPIIINNIVFIPKILQTEEDFIIEGHQMKNCMSSQFSHGIIFIYISLKSEIGTINLQYKRGSLVQGRGKANININEQYKEVINILTSRMMSNPDIKWIKEKFDFL